MQYTKQQYNQLAKEKSPPSKSFKNCCWAFLVGGSICLIGQLLVTIYQSLGLLQKDAYALCSSSLVLLSVILTAFGVYDDIAKHAGAGTLVPITGFANAVVSPAIEFKSEGFVLGVGAKMFIIAGPVIVYGVVASMVYGVIYWITTLF